LLNLVWDKLLPALQSQALPADTASHKQLETKLAGLALRTVEGGATSPLAAKVLGRTFVFPENDQKLESVTLMPEANGNGLVLVTQSTGIESRISCGYGAWKKGRAPFAGSLDEPGAASGAWLTDDTYVVKLFATETPHGVTMKFRFDGDRVFHDAEANVAFGPTKRPQLVGQAK
jgi:hypothetical protein